MIEPGETFTIEYGNGHTISVLALSLRNQQKLAALVRELGNLENLGGAESLGLFDKIEDALRLCVPSLAEDDSLLDQIDGETAMDIAAKTLNKQEVDADQLKKSESQPSSEPASSAKTAASTA